VIGPEYRPGRLAFPNAKQALAPFTQKPLLEAVLNPQIRRGTEPHVPRTGRLQQPIEHEAWNNVALA